MLEARGHLHVTPESAATIPHQKVATRPTAVLKAMTTLTAPNTYSTSLKYLEAATRPKAVLKAMTMPRMPKCQEPMPPKRA